VSIDELFTQWATRSVLTIGIGDRGNEIGFGSISDAVRAARPDAATCQCGCGGGVVAATATDLLLPSAVSNWGAYGIAASLGLLSRDPGCLVTPAEESRLLQTAAVRGCRDGVRRRGTFSVDAVSGSVSVAVVRALEDLVVDTLSRPKNEDACA
jgi:hypothetical protein